MLGASLWTKVEGLETVARPPRPGKKKPPNSSEELGLG